MEDEKAQRARDKVASILGGAKRIEPPAPSSPAGPTVTGNNNVVGDQNVVVTGTMVYSQKVVVRPGEEHISQEQASAIRDLVDQVVIRERAVSRFPKGYQAVWRGLQRHMHVTRYLLIPRDRFDEATAFLEAWTLRLDKGWPRSPDALKAATHEHLVHVITKAVDALGWGAAFSEYLRTRFEAAALDDLNSDQLWLAHHHLQAMIADEGSDSDG